VFTTRGVVNCFGNYRKTLLYIHFFRPARSLESEWRKRSLRHQDFDSTRLVVLDTTRLCWCVRTAAAAVLSKPQSPCRVFVSLAGLDSRRLCWCVRTLRFWWDFIAPYNYVVPVSLLSPSSFDSSRDFGLSYRTANTLSVRSVRLSILVYNLLYQFSHLSGSSWFLPSAPLFFPGFFTELFTLMLQILLFLWVFLTALILLQDC